MLGRPVNPSPKHVPFASAFRPNFEVVEERHGKVSLFPHTEQLPLLYRALNLEFRNALPDYIARTDRRGDGFHKQMLRHAALLYCNLFNAARTDGLHLQALPDYDLVTRPAIVQQLTRETRRGALHRFKFYGGGDFFEEVRISGRQIAFTDHLLQRFTARVPNRVGEHLSWLLLVIFGSPIIALPVGPGLAFILPYNESILAFPFELEDNEIVLTTCLTIHEMNSLERQLPPLAFNVHYGPTCAVPRIRHWLPAKWMFEAYEKWERKVPLPPPQPEMSSRLTWHRVAHLIRDSETAKGHGPGTKFSFLDHIPGPYVVDYLPTVPEPRVDERQVHKNVDPDPNWDDIFDQRDHFILNFENRPPPAAPQPA